MPRVLAHGGAQGRHAVHTTAIACWTYTVHSVVVCMGGGAREQELYVNSDCQGSAGLCNTSYNIKRGCLHVHDAVFQDHLKD